MQECNVCGASCGEPVYVSTEDRSVSSLGEILPGKTVVSFCAACGHLLTPPVPDIDAYYDEQYQILIDTEAEDLLYEVRDGRQIFRSEHQAETLLAKVTVPNNACVLDYGCAKAATLKQLTAFRPDITPYLFDVSETYLPFWEKFVSPENRATYAPKPEWKGRFDLITSFYAMEHVAEPRVMLAHIANLLKPGGVFYGIVPNVYANVADFVVVDHVNHFSAASLSRLLRASGLEVLEIDAAAHESAFVFTARKPSAVSTGRKARAEKTPTRESVQTMADYWACFAERVRAFENAHATDEVGVYGSGFYGTFIAACLQRPERIACFVDRNPCRQGKALLGRPIVAADEFPADVQTIYVGLNPAYARDAVRGIEAWRDRNHLYFYP